LFEMYRYSLLFKETICSNKFNKLKSIHLVIKIKEERIFYMKIESLLLYVFSKFKNFSWY